MKRLKNVSVFLLTLLLGLCVISTPALAEWPWSDNPGRGGQGSADSPGQGAASVGTDERVAPATSYYSVLTEISCRLAEFFVDDAKTLSTIQSSPDGSKNEPTKVK